MSSTVLAEYVTGAALELTQIDPAVHESALERFSRPSSQALFFLRGG
jgi:hypothetical protein